MRIIPRYWLVSLHTASGLLGFNISALYSAETYFLRVPISNQICTVQTHPFFAGEVLQPVTDNNKNWHSSYCLQKVSAFHFSLHQARSPNASLKSYPWKEAIRMDVDTPSIPKQSNWILDNDSRSPIKGHFMVYYILT
jgi:hypothetical protein